MCKRKIAPALLEVKAEKEDAEKYVLACIENFEDITGFNVESVEYFRVNIVSHGGETSLPLKSKVTLRLKRPFE